jgi:S-adenosylmethionine hydrolase
VLLDVDHPEPVYVRAKIESTVRVIVSLLSDFGVEDPYVGVMKAVVLGICPTVSLVDLTHEVPPQDVMTGALHLMQAAPHFPRGAVHLAVVDPGVGSRRRAIAVETERAFFVGPDNGLASLAWGRVVCAVELPIPRGASATFHGRDVFAPAAGRLAAGAPLVSLGRPATGLAKLAWPRPRRRGPRLRGEIVHVDRFGNLITNLTARDLGARFTLRAGEFNARRLQRTYADAAPGALLLLVGSSGLVEIAARDGSAAARLGLRRGDAVAVEHH